MPSTGPEQIEKEVHSALVSCVKEVQRANRYSEDVWFNYCHVHAPAVGAYNYISKDPARYSHIFLGDFLQHISKKCKDEDAIQEFSCRKFVKVERFPRNVA